MAPKKDSVQEKKAPDPAPRASATVAATDEPLAEGEPEGPPPPTFEEMWFDDPVEGAEAQRLALEIRDNAVLMAETPRIYLERTILPLLLQGLQHLAAARPSDPAEWLAAFFLKNNPRKDMVITQPVIVDPFAAPPLEPAGELPPVVDAPPPPPPRPPAPAKGKK